MLIYQYEQIRQYQRRLGTQDDFRIGGDFAKLHNRDAFIPSAPSSPKQKSLQKPLQKA
jgi:hypothetical protein